ncbi:MAG TPA: nuclear transport factor 2 family protein [Terriglobales bacterium]|nr:nuclear transport factor 2 family protein [Terriglobales bacterium]
MPKAIDDVIAEAEIRELQMRYCRAVDRMDFDLLRGCFHPDAQTDYGYFGGDVDAFIAAAREGLKAYSVTTHFTGNQLIEIDGDSAWAEHYAIATHRTPADEQGRERDFVTSVRYIDAIARRDGTWKLTKRRLILDWSRIDIVEQNIVLDVEMARRDRSDVSYERPD